MRELDEFNAIWEKNDGVEPLDWRPSHLHRGVILCREIALRVRNLLRYEAAVEKIAAAAGMAPLNGPERVVEWVLSCLGERQKLRESLHKIQSSCPCSAEFGLEPCNPSCPCCRPLMSGVCAMCCTVGSDEQRKAQAQKLLKSYAFRTRLREELTS